MSQRQFGEALGVSHRTATRWDARQSHPYESEILKLVRLLVDVDPVLAAEAAAHAHETLEGLGLAKPVQPPAPATAPEDLADIVVCAVADLTDTSPRALRPMIYTAFKRAREVGLSVEAVERALAPKDAAPPAPAKAAKKKT